VTSSLTARLAAGVFVGALATGSAGSAVAAHQPRPADPPPQPAPTSTPVPPQTPDNSDRYCQQDPDWYLCQHHKGK
jgi:hypothetical protein